MKLQLRKCILLIFIILLSVTIFIFSNENGIKSENTSDIFTSIIIDKVSKNKINKQDKEEIIIKARKIVRKTAHFTLYFTLGIFIYLLLKNYNIKHSLLISILLCFVFACSDEMHQLFIPGRTAQIFDIFIDTLGSLTGIFITQKISK